MIEIRPIQSSELTILQKIATDAYWQTFGESTTVENNQRFLDEAYTLQQFERELNEANSNYYLAWDGNEAAGFLRMRLSGEVNHLLGDNTVELQRLYIHPDHQGKKIGSVLMNFALDYASQRKFEWIWLGVWEFNFRAQAFYKKFGFKRFSEHVFQVGDDPQIDWLLKKRVETPSY